MSDDETNPDTNRGYYKVRLGVTHRELARMTEEQLASWQSQFSDGTAQFLLGEREWQRRLVVEQVNATKFSGWLGVVGSISAALLGVVLGYFLGTQSTKEEPQSKTTTEGGQKGTSQIQRQVTVPEPPAAPPIVQTGKPLDVKPNDRKGQQEGTNRNAKP